MNRQPRRWDERSNPISDIARGANPHSEVTELNLEGALTVALFTADLVAIGWVVTRKRSPASALAWTVTILFLPLVGLAAFLIFGRNRLPRRLRRQIAHSALFAERLEVDRLLSEPTEATDPGWEGLSRLARELGASPVRGGNEVIHLHTGAVAGAAFLRAIEEARHHVHVEEYIFRNDDAGREILEAMIRRAAQGVEVRLLVDAIGTPAAHSLFRRLQRVGGRGAVFLPLFPFGKTLSPNLRLHRKIIVVDGKVGFLGGMNIGDEYLGRGLPSRYWRDQHLELRGPAALDLQHIFVQDWDLATGELLAGAQYFPPVRPAGHSRVQLLGAGPEQHRNAIRRLLFAAITRARHRIRVSSPYLLPDTGLEDALCVAALRGVQVELLTQGRPPETWLTWFGSRYHWEELLSSGVRIWQYRPGILHAKSMIVDDAVACIGSPNMDNRSLRLNFEVLGLLGSDVDVLEASRRFDADLRQAEEVDLATFLRRPAWQRPLEVGARLLEPLL